jgi:hypothetical protein
VVVTIGPKAGTLIGTIGDAVTGKAVNPISDAVTGTPASVELRLQPATEEGRPFNRVVGPRFTTLIPPDADLELEIRAPGYQLWRFSAHSGKPFRMKSGTKRTLQIRLRPDPH